MKYILSSIFLSLVLLSSCEKSITINLPEEPKKLVINSIVLQGGLIYAHLTRSLSNAESGKNADVSVAGAQAVLYKDGQVVDTLKDEGFGLYTSDVDAEAGHRYRLVVTHRDYPTLEAETDAPVPVAIKDWSVVHYARSSPNSGDQDILKMRFDDPGTANDHYIMQILNANESLYEDLDFYSWGDCLQITDPSFESPYSAEFPGEEVCFPSHSLFFKDALFNGKEKELSMYVSSYQLNPYWPWQGTDTTYAQVRMYHVTPEFYQFVKTFRASQNASDNPFAEPFNIVSTVKGGYGVFSILSVESFEVKE